MGSIAASLVVLALLILRTKNENLLFLTCRSGKKTVRGNWRTFSPKFETTRRSKKSLLKPTTMAVLIPLPDLEVVEHLRGATLGLPDLA